MISLKCKNCGGEMSIDMKGELACPYCGTKDFLSDTDFKDYKEFRLNMLNFLRAAADANAEKDDGTFFWNFQDSITYYSADGTEVNIKYLFYTEEDGVKTYVAKESVVYVFEPSDVTKANKIATNLAMLDYPSADIKNLSKYFPFLKTRIELNNGGLLMAYSKPENSYPLFAFGSLKPEHVAWIVSRMENFCCLFEYSDIVHDGLSINSIFINPKTHEAYLYGGWWKAHKKLSRLEKNDLYAIRKVAGQIVGEYAATAPKEFVKFIKGRPESDAYTDFQLWDTVIENGFGGHKFVSFSK